MTELDKIFAELEDGWNAVAKEHGGEVEVWRAEPAKVFQFPGNEEAGQNGEDDLEGDQDPSQSSAEDLDDDPVKASEDDDRGLAEEIVVDLKVDDDETMH